MQNLVMEEGTQLHVALEIVNDLLFDLRQAVPSIFQFASLSTRRTGYGVRPAIRFVLNCSRGIEIFTHLSNLLKLSRIRLKVGTLTRNELVPNSLVAETLRASLIGGNILAICD